MLHDRQRDADDVRFLEGTTANHGLVHLPGDGDDRSGIQISIGNRSHQIGRARAAGAHADASLARRAGITFRREGTALLMTRQDGANLLRLRERLVNFHARAAGIREDDFDAFAFQSFYKNITPEHGLAHFGAFRLLLLRGCCCLFAHTFLSFPTVRRGQ